MNHIFLFSSERLISYRKVHHMFKSHFTKILLVALLALSSSAVLAPNHASAQSSSSQKSSVMEYMKKRFGSELSCVHVPSIEQAYLNYHTTFSQKTAELEKRVVEQFLKNQDPLKIYLTSDDILKVQTFLTGIFEKTAKSDCQFLTDTQNLVIKKVRDRLQFVKTTLGNSYKLDKSVSFIYDPDKREWAKSDKELESYLKEYIHFQVATYLAMDMKLKEAKSKVIKNYERAFKRLEEKKEDDLIVNYLDAYARSLDPHTSFFSRDYLADFEIQMSLELEGIGATLSSQDGFTVVEQLVPGGAAARSKLINPQDKIIAVAQGKDGKFEDVIDMDLSDVVKKIRGKAGTQVRLKILRKEGESTQKVEVALQRAKVNLEDEAASITYIEKPIKGEKKTIGIINLPSFYADARKSGRSSAEDVKKLIKEARTKNVSGLVLDLSMNGGGSLNDAVQLAGLFFRTGNVVKQSSKSKGREEITLADTDPTVDWNGPLVVLTSRISASASEIVSGTLKDYQRAVIVGGDHTFGKGSVQQVVPINGELGALKVTVGMFYIPGGKSTQHGGVDADIPLPGAFSNDEMGEKSLDYSLPPSTLSPFISKSAYVSEGPERWKPIRPEWIQTLKDNSKKRVEQNKEFQKIIADVEKSKKKGKLIKISDILSDKSEKEKIDKQKAKRTMSKDEKIAEYLKRADIEEATLILGDLITLDSSSPSVGLSNNVSTEKKHN